MKKNEVIYFLFLMLFLVTGAEGSFAQLQDDHSDLQHWTKNNSPLVIGEWLTKHFINTPHPGIGGPGSHIIYPEVCTWYGALTFAQKSKNKRLMSQLTDRFDPLFGPESNLVPVPNHVDNTVFGAIPLELYILTQKQKYLGMGRSFADKQWETPAEKDITPESAGYLEQGLSWQTRMWIDDMFMITLVQTQAYRATGDQKYINRAAKEMTVYLDSLQRPNGLFFHAPDVPFFWGRGNGWVASGMAILLSSLPEENPDRMRIMKAYKTMMASLLKFQTKDGMWHQLIDDPQSWAETSCTGMFTFAMITGVKNGWLDSKIYGQAARKGWLALISYLDKNGDIRNVCEGTGKKDDRQYYLDRKRITGDLHGQAPVLWCATALLP